MCGGCQKTCKEPEPVCTAVCRAGCYCLEGQVRNDTGHCVNLADCPPRFLDSVLDTSEPRSPDFTCPQNEQYEFCGVCNKTCDNPHPICPAQCNRGCYCKRGFLRNNNGTCVSRSKCPNKNLRNNDANSQKSFLICGVHQHLEVCSNETILCEKTCSDPAAGNCNRPCQTGCYCEDGYFRAPNGECVKLNNCPKATELSGTLYENSVEECSPDEEYFSSGWCEATCSDPTPRCPNNFCTRGCQCKVPMVRHHSGICVRLEECEGHCRGKNEEYACQNCELTCSSRECEVRNPRCSLGCHCATGFLRNKDGLCVTPDLC